MSTIYDLDDHLMSLIYSFWKEGEVTPKDVVNLKLISTTFNRLCSKYINMKPMKCLFEINKQIQNINIPQEGEINILVYLGEAFLSISNENNEDETPGAYLFYDTEDGDLYMSPTRSVGGLDMNYIAKKFNRKDVSARIAYRKPDCCTDINGFGKIRRRKIRLTFSGEQTQNKVLEKKAMELIKLLTI